MLTFANGQEMYDCLQHGDLYNEEQEMYVFLYNEDGAVCSYSISPEDAAVLEKKAYEANEYWGAFLGVGGYIHDDPLSFCADSYKGVWRRV